MFSAISKFNRVVFKSNFRFSTVLNLPGNSQYKENTKHVSLRGQLIKGKYNDLPNLIFFSEAFDPVSNWVNFFTHPENDILEYRNVYLLNPRNFGNSDYNESFELEEMADDVIRFMYEHKISTATIGGHGFGAKLALGVGCYHAERVTGVFGLDGGPFDHRWYQPYREMRQFIKKAREINLNRQRNQIETDLKEQIDCKKWRSILNQNLIQMNPNQFKWNFNMEFINRNLEFNGPDSLGAWNEKYGMYTGRVCFIFPEYSRYVQLNTNTLAMLKVCARCKGYGQDVFAIQGDDNTHNHWMYEFENESYVTMQKLSQFLRLYDGVHGLLYDRSEIGNYFIPDRIHSRNNSNHVYSDYSPAHLHHNWRFSNIYEKHTQYEQEALQEKLAQMNENDSENDE